MSNTIIAHDSQQSVALKGVSCIARKPLSTLFLGGSWTKIRVAAFVAIETLNQNIAEAGFSLGLCSGTTNLPCDPVPTNAIGIQFKGVWQYSNNSYVNWIANYFKNVAGTYTDFYDSGVLSVFRNDLGATKGYPLFADITKGSPNFSVQYFLPTASSAVGIILADYLTLTTAASPSVTGMGYDTVRATAFSESNGTLDTAFLTWAPINPRLRVRDFRVVRLS